MNKYEHIVVDPRRFRDQPMIKGTQVFVVDVLRRLADGQSFDAVRADYPDLTDADISAALTYSADEIIRNPPPLEIQAPYTLADLRARRTAILTIATQHKASNIRFFGSVARGDAQLGSDCAMNRQIEYLTSINERIHRIHKYVEAGQAAFFASPLIQDAVIRNFEIIGEISRRRLDDEVKRLKPEIGWRQVGDFRKLIHEYDSIDLTVVWNAIVSDLPALSRAVTEMIALLQPPSTDETKDSHEPAT